MSHHQHGGSMIGFKTLSLMVALPTVVAVSIVTAQMSGDPWKKAAALPESKGKAAVMAKIKSTNNQSLTIRYKMPVLSATEVPDGAVKKKTRLTLGNAPVRGNEGAPVLPVVPVQFIVPFGKEIASVTVRGEKRTALQMTSPVEFGSAPMALSKKDNARKAVAKTAIYESSSAYPAVSYEVVTVQEKKGVKVGVVNLHPVSYFPKLNRVEYCEEWDVTVTFKPAMKLTQKTVRFRATQYEMKKLGVENPDAVLEYKESSKSLTTKAAPTLNQMLLDPAESYQYVVITSEAIRDATTDVTINDLINHRKSLGMTATLVTIESILADYAGVDDAEKVRNFITDAYTNWETEYVVLGGDINIIPIRDFYLTDDGASFIHSDLYYQCLDGTFNEDGDEYYGEPTDGENGGDVDLYSEVSVGRISAENADEMSNAVYKILAYERSDDSEDYLRNFCLVGEYLGSQFGPDIFGYAKPYMNEIKNGSSAAGYTTVGVVACPAIAVDSLDDFDAEWPVDSLIYRINANKYSIINHLGHANTDYVMKMSNHDADSLTNNKFLFTFSQGCFPGDMTTDCIAEHLTTSTRSGLFAGVFNSHYGWGSYNDSFENMDGPSQRIDRQFWDAFFGEYIFNLGTINADSHEDNVWDIGGDLVRWCIYETNLFGDPATYVRGQFTGPKAVVSSSTYSDVNGGNGDHIVNPGEQLALSLQLKNIGNTVAEQVTATVSINDPYITVSSGTLSFGDLACCGALASSNGPATISVAGNCPTPYTFPLTIEMSDKNGNSWLGTVNLTVYNSYTISGKVLTLTGLTPVAGVKVKVTGPLSGEVTTNGAGEYVFSCIDGSYEVLAEASGYLPVEPIKVSLPPSAANVDFMVTRPQIAVTPASISQTLVVNDSIELPLSITNSGDAPLAFGINVRDITPPDALVAKKRYDAAHYVPQKKGTPDRRGGNPVPFGKGGPDAFGYSWIDSDEANGPAFVWNDISETGILLPSASDCDDCFDEQPLSFTFPFYGNEFNTVFIGSNGYLTFGQGSYQFWNVPLPSVEAPPNLIAAFLSDLVTYSKGEVYFQDFGTYAVTQYNNVEHLSYGGSFTFQIVIEQNGAITFYYKSIDGNTLNMTAGIQNEAMNDGLTIVYNAAYLKNDLAVRIKAAPGWCTVAPEAGIVAAGETVNVNVKLNSTALAGGDYSGLLNIKHNVPGEAIVAVPVALSIDGFKSLTADPTSISFGNLWLGLKDTIAVTLSNTGTQSAVVSSVSSNNPVFSVVTPLPLRVKAGKSAIINVAVAPEVLGPASAQMMIVSDAEDNPSIGLNASVVATQGPDAELTPEALQFELDPKDAPADLTAVLANVGGDVLSYKVSIRQKSKPQFAAEAAPSRNLQGMQERRIYSPYNYRNEFALDRVIVAFKEGKGTFANVALATQFGSGKVRELATAKVPKKGIRSYTGKKLVVVPLANSQREGVLEAIKQIRLDDNVAYVEPDYRVKAIGIPNDPLFSQQYALNNSGQTGGKEDADIDAPEAWDITTGENSEVILAIIDTGIDYLHPDLAGNIWTNSGEIAGNGVDDDANGFVDDVYGYDFAYDDSDPMDGHGHGTHCSGISAGRGNDGVGVSGVSWGARLMGVKFLDDGGSGWTSDAVDALAYAYAMGATVSSNSWGGGGYEQSLYDMIAATGLFVAAAGNEGSDADMWPAYPAAYDLENIVSVAATDHNDDLAYFSNWGLTTVDLGAPGVDILSSLPGNQHDSWSGTSMATPHVSGCAVLLKSYNPLLSTAELKAALLSGVDVIPSLEGKTVSGGRLNLVKALDAVVPPWISVAPAVPGTVPAGSDQQFTVTASPKGLVAGTWVAEVVFKTDDPFKNDHILTVTAEVAPCKSLRSATEVVAFNTVWVGRDTTGEVVLANDCNAPVTISALALSNPVFTSVLELPVTVRPFGTVKVPVKYTPAAAGTSTGNIIITSDAEDNPSISVGIYGQSVTPPVITVTPATIDRTLAYETSQSVPVTMQNTGGAPFQFKVKTRYQKMKTAGSPVDLSDATVFVSHDFGTIQKVDITTGEFIGEPLVMKGSDFDALAYDGEYLYYVNMTNEVIRINPESMTITDTMIFDVPTFGTDGIGVTSDYLIIGNYGDAKVYVCDKATGAVVYTWSAPGFLGGLAASESRESVFFYDYSARQIQECSLTDGTIKSSIPVNYPMYGLAYSEGADILLVGSPYEGLLLVVDPATGATISSVKIPLVFAVAADEAGATAKWLTSGITEGTVSPGSSLTFNANLNSAGVLPGLHGANLSLEHALPYAPGPYTIAATMTVLEEKRCAASPWSLSFVDTWVGRTDTLGFYLVNSGNVATTVSSIKSNSALFVPLAKAPFFIPEFDSVFVPVTFTPKKAKNEAGQIVVQSDAVKAPSVTVSLSGTALNPPKISYTPKEIIKAMLPGKEQQVNVNFKNNGGADYRCKITLNDQSTSNLIATNWDRLYHVDPMTGEVVSSVEAYLDVNAIAFDGKELFCATNGTQVDVRDTGTGELIRMIPIVVENAGVYTMEIGVDAENVILDQYYYDESSMYRRVQVLDKVSGAEKAVWIINDEVEGLCNGFEDNTIIMRNYKTNELETRNMMTGELIKSLPVKSYGYRLTCNKSKKQIYLSDGGTHNVIDATTGNVVTSFYSNLYYQIAANEVGGASWINITAEEAGVIPAKGTLSFQVNLNSAKMLPGTYKASITVVHEKGWEPGPFVIPIEMTVLPLRLLAADPTSLDFGSVPIGSDMMQNLILRNDGNAATTVSMVTSGNAVFSITDALPVVVPAYGQIDATARFAPVKKGKVSTTVVISSDADKQNINVKMSGSGVAASAKK